MKICLATLNDVDIIDANDEWVNRDTIVKKIEDNQIYIAYDNNDFVGWLRYGLFWDTTPYMNMLYLLEQYRGKGIGRSLVTFWENEMKSKDYEVLLTSSSQNEHAQHFYVKLGYKAIGSFSLVDEPLEIMFAKFI
jgi:ribosomal protein S18 acetylase RimI-like enzyme